MPLMIDLFSGLGGASEAMKTRGWKVVRVELERMFAPDVVANVKHLPIRCRPDLLWASPPCTKFTRQHMKCWYPNDPPPDMSLVEATYQAVRQLKPKFWIMENVIGAQKFIGLCTQRFGKQYLWGDFPLVMMTDYPKRGPWVGRPPEDRAKIPHELSLAVARTIEGAL